jgi:hypothetical protein
MKIYMNRADREHHLMMLIAWDYFSNWLDKTNCLTTNERKRIKTARTHLLHASDSIIDRMDEKYAKTLLREAKNKELRFANKNIGMVSK